VTLAPAIARRFGRAAGPATASVDVRFAVGLGALALLFRLAFVLAYPPTSFNFSDPLFYQVVAARLAHGDGFTFIGGAATAHWPPLVPFLLSLIYRVTGPDPQAAVAYNALLGAATVPLLYAVALRALGRGAAIAAALALALMPGQILFADAVLAETTYTFLLVGFLALVALVPERGWKPVLLGAAVGVAALTRGEGLLLFVVPLAVWWPELGKRELAGRMALLIVTAAVVIVPWTIRNAAAMDAFVPIATNSSTTLWSGHNPKADGGPTYAPPSVLAPIAHTRGAEREVAEARLLRKEAFAYMRSHPGRELELIPLKLLSLNRGDSQVLGTWISSGGEASLTVSDLRSVLENSNGSGSVRRLLAPAPPVLDGFAKDVAGLLADGAYYLLLAATLAALVLVGSGLWRNRALRGVLAMFGAALFAYGFVYYGNYRYRIPLEPLMMLVAASLVPRLWGRGSPAPS
jgi:Dolichyl-phosphate-mannose-protein mannosyltransferase